MTLEECDEHIGARVVMSLTERHGTLVSTGTWAAYVQFDGEARAELRRAAQYQAVRRRHQEAAGRKRRRRRFVAGHARLAVTMPAMSTETCTGGFAGNGACGDGVAMLPRIFSSLPWPQNDPAR